MAKLSQMQLRILKVLKIAGRWLTRNEMVGPAGHHGFALALGAPTRGELRPGSLEQLGYVERRDRTIPFEYRITELGKQALAEYERKHGEVSLKGKLSGEAVRDSSLSSQPDRSQRLSASRDQMREQMDLSHPSPEPIAVPASTDRFPAGRQEQPSVWRDAASGAIADVEPLAPLLKPKPQPGVPSDREVVEQAPTTAKEEQAAPEWISRLLASPIFAEQKRLGGRGLPPDEVFAQLLAALDRRGGKLTAVALARALEFPALRLPGLLAKAQRVLNIDGYAVLRRDDASDTVELNRDLLLKQFDLM